MSAVFRAVAHPTRRRILHLLAARPRSAGELVQAFDVSQPGISRHLRVLREAGLVRQSKRSQQRIYTLQPQPLQEIYDWVSFYQDFWDDRLEALDRWLDDDA